MSKLKTSTGDLSSIYRLEFYKKKRDWILCDTKETPKQEPSMDKETNVSLKTSDEALNVTYNLDQPNVLETSLNEAFFETDSEIRLASSSATSLLPVEKSQQFEPELNADQGYPDVVPYNWWFPDLSTQKQELNQEVKSEGSLESISEFMRGAHCAPHSSEIDLQDAELFEDLLPDDLARQSTKQLQAIVAKHSTALDSLLSELRVRELMQPRTYLSLNNYQEYTQPHTTDLNYVYSILDADIYSFNNPQNSLPNNFQFRCNSFLTGYEGAVGRGRGRGRLRDYQFLGGGRGRARI